MSRRNLYLAALAGLVATLPVAAASAADLGTGDYYADPAPLDTAQDWSGNYVGAQIGASSSEFPNPFSNRTGALGGVVVGKNFQNGKFVYGGELEANFAEAEHRLGRGGTLQQSWSGVAKARAGIAMDKTLIYGALGYGATKFKPKGTVTSGSDWEGGVLLGAGVEQVISGPLSVKAEYDYMRFGDVKTEVGGRTQRDNLSNHAIKAGVNYKF
ncbi:porin family protein [Phyllobacterium salinisoli]|uniref:Porin family protein n=1 Tax=Phyllobacterium salinisoli TaxID=1899321 RepID=A0A368K7F9_9HYPH|nr:outer membrane protein [Phyllobacterium salinisoli]RCS24575.1 porin family protein [Phyllobacterium salinisoli]